MTSSASKLDIIRPDLILIGATKCATSWLHLALQKHPEAAMVTNETWFFSEHFDEGTDWMAGYARLYQPDKLWGDYSNDYFTSPDPTIGNILAETPDAKLVLALRDPVDRAKSFYQMFFRSKKVGNDPTSEVVPGRRLYDEGMYFQNLQPFLRAFGRDRIHVVIYDDIQERDAEVVRELYEFAGLDPHFVPDILGKTYNKGQRFRPRSVKFHKFWAHGIDRLAHTGRVGAKIKEVLRRSSLKRYYHRLNKGEDVPAFPPEFCAKLARDYEKDILQLGELLGRDLHAQWIAPRLK